MLKKGFKGLRVFSVIMNLDCDSQIAEVWWKVKNVNFEYAASQKYSSQPTHDLLASTLREFLQKMNATIQWQQTRFNQTHPNSHALALFNAWTPIRKSKRTWRREPGLNGKKFQAFWAIISHSSSLAVIHQLFMPKICCCPSMTIFTSAKSLNISRR